MKLVMQYVKQKIGKTILEIDTKTTKLLRSSLKSKRTFTHIYNQIWRNVSLSDVLAMNFMIVRQRVGFSGWNMSFQTVQTG